MYSTKNRGKTPWLLDPECDELTWINQLFALYCMPIGVATAFEYRRVINRLDGEHWDTYARRRDATKSYRAVLRAAWRRHITRQLLAALVIQRGRPRRAPHISTLEEIPEACQALVDELLEDRAILQAEVDEDLAPFFAQSHPDSVRASPNEEGRATADKRRPSSGHKKSTRKGSKAKSLRDLPSDWIGQLVEGMTTSEDSLLTATAAITGCRPEELRKGVALRLRDDGRIDAEILGSKVSDRTDGGQDWRLMAIDPTVSLGHLGARYLYDAFEGNSERTPRRSFLARPGKNAPKTQLVVTTQGRGWQQRMTRIAKQLGFTGVSPYTLRHDFATRIRSSTGNTDDLSAALGHRSARMKRHYGSRRKGGGAHGISQIETAEPIRQTGSAMAGTDNSMAANRNPPKGTEVSSAETSLDKPMPPPAPTDEIEPDEDLLKPPDQPGSKNGPKIG